MLMVVQANRGREMMDDGLGGGECERWRKRVGGREGRMRRKSETKKFEIK